MPQMVGKLRTEGAQHVKRLAVHLAFQGSLSTNGGIAIVTMLRQDNADARVANDSARFFDLARGESATGFLSPAQDACA